MELWLILVGALLVWSGYNGITFHKLVVNSVEKNPTPLTFSPGAGLKELVGAVAIYFGLKGVFTTLGDDAGDAAAITGGIGAAAAAAAE